MVGVLAQGLVNETPVDTGRLRNNWLFGKSAIPTGTLPGIDPDGRAALARIVAGASTLKAGGECWIVNNLPYAGRIEYGYSQKNPHGMVRVTLANMPAAIDAIFRARP